MYEQQHTAAACEKRMHPRQTAAGTVDFKAYWGPYEASTSPDSDTWQLPKFYSKIYSLADLIDAGLGGMRIKTSIPLEKGVLVEINQPVRKRATVRWVAEADDHYHVGLMYI